MISAACSMKEAFRSIASYSTVYSGMTAVGRKLVRKDGALIFYGHRVADDNEGYLRGLPPAYFEEQLAYLTRHYEIISLTRLLDCYEQHWPVPHRSAVITFDDGFRDNLVNALPLLERYNAPATIFVATGCISSGELPWSQRLGFLFQTTKKMSVELPVSGGGRFDLTTRAARAAAYRTAKEPLKSSARAERERQLATFSELLEVEAPRDRMLSWDDLAAMQSRGVELGAHTYSHPLLARIPQDEAIWEMERSRDDLSEHFGITRPPFCFPAGSQTAELFDTAERLGFRSAFQPDSPHRINNLETTHPFSLARVGLPEAPAVFLEAEIDGPLHSVRTLLRGVCSRRTNS
jgi:peptidoglycan/xylan/chitin deacetylase (PgdA/CDA1 family)